MKVRIQDVMLDTETGEQFALPASDENIYSCDISVEDDVNELNALQAASEAADDDIEIPPAPEGMSLVEWLIEQSVIPADTPVFEVSDADDVADIIENYVGDLDKGETIH